MKLKLLFFLLIPFLGLCQVQIGQTIYGDTLYEIINHKFDISENGKILATATPYKNAQNGIESGSVKVYKFNQGSWIQLGQEIFGDKQYDNFGVDISLSSDGNTLAILNRNRQFDDYYVKIFKFYLGSWVQIGNNIEFGTSTADRIESISLSGSGDIIALGNPLSDINGYQSGTVRIYQNVSNNWVQLGNDIYGENINERIGSMIYFHPNLNVLAVSYKSQTFNTSVGVRVFAKNSNSNNWYKIGDDIYDTSSIKSFSLGSTKDNIVLGIGIPLKKQPNFPNTKGIGIVQVLKYDYIQDKWLQMGSEIHNDYVNGGFGNYISLSHDATRIAVNIFNIIEHGFFGAGLAQVYQFTNGNWQQIGKSIGDDFRYSMDHCVALSGDGNILAVGIDGNPTYHKIIDTSSIRVFDINQTANINTLGFSEAIIYPNPTSDVLNISLENNFVLEEVTIYNIAGQKVKTSNQTVLNVNNLNSGVYLVEIITNKGKAKKQLIIK